MIKNFKLMAMLAFLLFFVGSAFAAMDINISSPTTGSYVGGDNGYVVLTFTLRDLINNKDTNVKIWDLNATDVNIFASTGKAHLLDINIDAHATDANLACTDTNIYSTVTCTYNFGTSKSDGNYYLDLNAYHTTGTYSDDNTYTNSFYLDMTDPTTPTGVNANNQTGKITINWDLNSTSDPKAFGNYKIYYATSELTTTNCESSGSLFETITSASTISSTVTGLTNGLNYWFCLHKEDAADNSARVIVAGVPYSSTGGGTTYAVSQQTYDQGGTTAPIQAGAIGGELNKPVQIGNITTSVGVVLGLGVLGYLLFFRKKRR